MEMITKRWNELTEGEQAEFVEAFDDGRAMVGDVMDHALLMAIEENWVPFEIGLLTVGDAQRLVVHPGAGGGPVPRQPTPEQVAKARVFHQSVILDPYFPVSFVPARPQPQTRADLAHNRAEYEAAQEGEDPNGGYDAATVDAMAAQHERDVADHYAGMVPADECPICLSEAPDHSEATSPAGWTAPEPSQYGAHGMKGAR